MNITKRDALITGLSYADIFDYPLTVDELQTWLPFIPARHSLAASQEHVLQGYHSIADNITYYSIRPGKRFVALRSKRLKLSSKKWKRARWIAGLLRCIRSITLVGVTGGLARSNANEQDDIDFFILCSPKTVWITRALTTILLDIFHLRRRPNDKNVSNLICLNMFMSEEGLALPARERDLFSAHEVLLMTPLWQQGEMHQKFLLANRWVKKFLPNAWEEKVKSSREAGSSSAGQKSKVKSKTQKMFALVIVIWLLRFTEVPARVLQLWYMSKRRSSEVVTDTVIRFHPQDAREWIKKKLGERLARFNIPLDKIFYAR